MYVMARANSRQAQRSLGSNTTGRVYRVGRSVRGAVLIYYERFLRLPTALVLTTLWLVGAALLTMCIMALYLGATFLIRILA